MKKYLSLVILVLAISLITVVSSSSIAQPTPKSRAQQHCIVRIEPIQPGETTSKIVSKQCYSSFRKLVIALTHGKLTPDRQLNNFAIRDSLDQYLRDEFATPLTVQVVSIIYDGTNYGGDSYVLESIYTCAQGTFGFQNMNDIGWNDRAASVRNYLCNKSTFFQDINYNNWTYAGTNYLCNSSACANFGAMNDQASSVRWTN